MVRIEIPADALGYVQQRVDEGGFGSVDAYVLELIRGDLAAAMPRDACVDEERERLVLEGLRSGPIEPLTAADFDAARQAVAARREGP